MYRSRINTWVSAGKRPLARPKQAEARDVGSRAPPSGIAGLMFLLIIVYSVPILFLQCEGTH